MLSPLQIAVQNIAAVQAQSAPFAKLTLALILIAVASGNRKPGNHILTAAIAAQLFLSAYVAFSLSGDMGGFPAAAVNASRIIAVFALLTGLGVAASFFVGKPSWSLASDAGWRKGAAWALIALGYWFPFCGQGVFRSILFSPMGALPHPVLMVAAAVAWLGMPQTNRLAAASIAAGALALGVQALIGGMPVVGVLLVAEAGLIAWGFFQVPRAASEPATEESSSAPRSYLPPEYDERITGSKTRAPKTPAKSAAPPPPEPEQKPKQSGKQWKLK